MFQSQKLHGVHHCAFQFVIRHAARFGGIGHILNHGQIAGQAEDVGQVAQLREAGARVFQNRASVEQNLAVRRHLQACQTAHQRGFAHAVRANQTGNAAARQMKVDVVQDVLPAVIKIKLMYLNHAVLHIVGQGHCKGFGMAEKAQACGCCG